MNEYKFTKGPWKWNGKCGIHGKYKNNTNLIVTNSGIRLDDDFNQEEQDANCQLISAAPELLEILEGFEKWYDSQTMDKLPDGGLKWSLAASEVIKKALRETK